MPAKAPNLGNIQGNILAGFNKDLQLFLFIKFKGATEGRAWIKAIADGDLNVGVTRSDSASVLKFYAQFKSLLAIAQSPSGPFRLTLGKAPITVNHFVATTGGEYFFCPSIDALRKISDKKI